MTKKKKINKLKKNKKTKKQNLKDKKNNIINQKDLNNTISYLEIQRSILINKLKLIPKNININPNKKYKNNLDFSDLKNLYDNIDLLHTIEIKLLEKLKITKIPHNIKLLIEGLTRGVSRYINENYKLKYPVSNGFIKLWEIYNNNDNLLNFKSNNINVFHMAEAPGQWINATDHFIFNFMIKNKIKNKVNYNWYANALNPYNPKNIKTYGKDIFKDTYGFIGKYQNRWLYGKDDTGDITNIKNIKWFKEYFLNKKFEPDLVTGDAGIGYDVPLKIKQKIDIAQCFMVLSCLKKGGNCVIKHFTPNIFGDELSKNATMTYINIIYTYLLFFKEVKLIKPLTSNPTSGEFYVLGYNFIGIKENILDKLLLHLENHNNNEYWITEKSINQTIKNKIINFIKNILKLNIKSMNAKNFLLGEYIKFKNKEKINSKLYVYLFKKTKEIYDKKINLWIKKNEFN